ncbi:hypothetical protein WMF30_21610 [Sorangium sp. So ce134]
MFATTEIDPNSKMRKAYQDVDNAIVAVEERNRLHGSETWTTVVTRYGYYDLYQLVSASGTYQDRRDWQDRYRLSFHFDEIGNILTKDQASYRFVPDGSGGWREDMRPGSRRTGRCTSTRVRSRMRPGTSTSTSWRSRCRGRG